MNNKKYIFLRKLYFYFLSIVYNSKIYKTVNKLELFLDDKISITYGKIKRVLRRNYNKFINLLHYKSLYYVIYKLLKKVTAYRFFQSKVCVFLKNLILKRLKNNVSFVILMFIYKILIEITYIFNLSRIYNYLGVTLDYNVVKMIFSWIIFIVLLYLILGLANDAFWIVVLQLLSVLVIVPSICLYGLKNIPTIYFIYDIIFWLLFIELARLTTKVKTKNELKLAEKIHLSTFLVNMIFIISAITVLIASYLYGGFRFIIGFNEIYKYRLALRNINMSVYFNYMIPIVGTILFPICLIEYLNRKRYCFVFLILVLGLMLFSINGMKTYLFVYFIVFVVFILTKTNYNKYSIINFFLIATIFVSIIGIFSSEIFKNNEASGIIYRMIVTTNEISYYFIDFVSNKTPLLLRGSILRHFFQYPYPMKLEYLIGGQYIGDYNTNANVGLLGDAYANFKILGVFIYPFMYISIFTVLKNIVNRYDYRTKYIVVSILIWTALNTSFFTWLLTGGVIILCLIYFVNNLIKNILSRE
jgi:hypothetical protein